MSSNDQSNDKSAPVIHPKLASVIHQVKLQRKSAASLCISHDEAIGLRGLDSKAKGFFVRRKHLDPKTSHTIIDCRSLSWQNDCPRSIDGLEHTDKADKFFCPQCKQDVYWSNSKAERNKHAQLGNNIAFAVDLPVKKQAPSVKRQTSDKFGMNLIRSILTSNTQLQIQKRQTGSASQAILNDIVAKLKRFQAQVDAGIRNSETGLILSHHQIHEDLQDIELDLAYRHMLAAENVQRLVNQIPQFEALLESEQRASNLPLKQETHQGDNQKATVIEFPS